MLTNAFKRISDFFSRLTISDYERYLSESADLAELERRMKYGTRPNQIPHPYIYGR